jgi:hypothetical protein
MCKLSSEDLSPFEDTFLDRDDDEPETIRTPPWWDEKDTDPCSESTTTTTTATSVCQT